MKQHYDKEYRLRESRIDPNRASKMSSKLSADMQHERLNPNDLAVNT